MRRAWLYCGLFGLLAPACRDNPALGPGSETTGPPNEPAPLCRGGGPLMSGDAEWVAAPIVPPGDMGQGGGNDDGNEEGGGQGFIDSPDGGGVGTECDIWAQDCPDGEKCMPWSNDGSGEWNATRCSPVADMPGSAGGACMVEGGPASGIDDCNERSMCWDVDRNNDGTCIGFCLGEQDQPYCPGDQWCFIGYEGAISVCMPAALCVPDGVCQCICPESADPDCEPEQCNPPEAASTPDELTATPPITTDEEPAQCPDSRDPVVLYMSNDDSNSQASPALARRMIAEGRVVSADQIRIHEFLNYYDLAGPSSQDAGATVGIQMRRTDAEKGEFTLVLQAQGRQLSAEQRPPL
ncbi:MAG: von Willebrand factor type A domain-containing protein, partial [Deltaproteobacteria bacterium]|nr:von Willebrand factor type A domain-containing protein [Deltaproteobacteria bacterium]